MKKIILLLIAIIALLSVGIASAGVFDFLVGEDDGGLLAGFPIFGFFKQYIASCDGTFRIVAEGQTKTFDLVDVTVNSITFPSADLTVNGTNIVIDEGNSAAVGGVYVTIMRIKQAATDRAYICVGESCTLYKVSDNIESDTSPDIDGRYIIWKNYDGDYEVYFYDILGAQTPIEITADSDGDYYPVVDGRYVAWRGENGSDDTVEYYDIISGGPIVQAYNTSYIRNGPELTSNGRFIIWGIYGVGNRHLYGYNTVNGVPGSYIDISNGNYLDNSYSFSFSDRFVTWTNKDNNFIGLYNLFTGTTISNFVSADSPSVEGITDEYILINGTNNLGDLKLYLYDISAGTEIILPDSEDGIVSELSGQNVVWYKSGSLYHYDITSGITEEITNNAQYTFFISDEGVAFESNDGNDYEIYYYDFANGIPGSPTQITNNAETDYVKGLSEDYIIFYEYGNQWNSYDIANGVTTEISQTNLYSTVFEENYLAWYAHDGNDYEIYYKDISTC